uniref:Secreted protein n=1 Tax=Macrostomum lignano TaxID=282301 RepID=A0A1I8IB35_9PLAT
MMWISFGLVLISMFTAVVTAALSQSAQRPEEDYRFFQTNITVINGSYEQVLVYELGSTPIAIADWKSLMQLASDADLDSNSAGNLSETNIDSGALGIGDTSDEAPHHGALVEHFMYLHIRQEHPGRMRSLKPQLVLKRPSIRGVHSNLPPRVGECLAENFLRHQIGIYRQLLGHRHVED